MTDTLLHASWWRQVDVRVRAHLRHSARNLDLAIVLVGLVGTLFWLSAPSLGIDQFRVPKELALMLVASTAAVVSLSVKSRVRVDGFALVLFGCLIWAVLALVTQAENLWLGWRLLGVYWSALLTYAVVRRYAFSRIVRMRVLMGIGVVALLAGLSVLLEYVGVIGGWSLLRRGPSGVFGNRNHAAHFLTFALPALLVVLVYGAQSGDQQSRTLTRLRALHRVALAATFVIAASITATRTRAAWLAALIGIGVAATSVIITQLRSRRNGASEWSPARGPLVTGTTTWLAMVVAGTITATLLPSAKPWSTTFGESVARLTDHREGSGRGRVVQYATTLRISQSHPLFGVGAGNWMIEYPRYARPGDPNLLRGLTPTDRLPLSDWLGTLAENGWPAAILLLVAAVLLARAALQQWWRTRDPGESSQAIALLMLLVMIGILGGLDAVLQTPAPAMICAVLVAVLTPARIGPVVTLPIRAHRRTFMLAVVLPSLFFLNLSSRRLRAAIHRSGGDTVSALESAVRADPTDFVTRVRLANSLVLAGKCEAARPQLVAAARLHPTAPIVSRLDRHCRMRRPAHLGQNSLSLELRQVSSTAQQETSEVRPR